MHCMRNGRVQGYVRRCLLAAMASGHEACWQLNLASVWGKQGGYAFGAPLGLDGRLGLLVWCCWPGPTLGLMMMQIRLELGLGLGPKLGPTNRPKNR